MKALPKVTISPGQNASVYANITDDLGGGVKNVTLIYYFKKSTQSNSIPMTLSRGNFLNGSYNGQIMPFIAKTIVSFIR